jgi:metal-responsive CopG/Arc/MetJ family transcriptional regulator
MARTHVVISDEVLCAIDEVVGKRGRSRFFEEAAREKLERAALERALDASFGILKAEDYPYWRDRETTAAWVRKVREEPAP